MKSGTYYVPAKHPQESVNQTGYIVIVLGIANPLQILKPALKGHVVPLNQFPGFWKVRLIIL
ncbi:MAG TPA: hypothetical protein DEQ54_05305 [Firmicutes bacterium]|jgi:hypothetical protein|nr:hypothetical protein [Bacillota bacterium]